RVAARSRVAALGVDHRPVAGLVPLGEAGRPGELGDDRAHLDLHLALVRVALDTGEPGARHARCDALQVGEHLPGALDRGVHGELVRDLHGVSWWTAPATTSRSSGVLAIVPMVASMLSGASSVAPSADSADTQSI